MGRKKSKSWLVKKRKGFIRCKVSKTSTFLCHLFTSSNYQSDRIMWQNHLDRFDRHRVIQNPSGNGCYTVIIYVWSDHNNSFLYFQWKLSKILHDNKCQNFSVFRKPCFPFQSSLYKFLSTYKYISLNIIRSFFYSRQSTGCSLNIVFLPIVFRNLPSFLTSCT